MTQLSLPGDPLVQHAVDWGKQNIADLTQSAQNLQIRWTNQGKQFPAPLGTVPAGDLDRRRLSPTTRGSSAPTRSTPRSPRWRSASSQAIEDHLRALRDVSDILNNRSGVVVHEAVSDGSIWFGHDSRTDQPGRHHDVRLQHRRDGQVPQHRRAGLAVDRGQRASVTRCTTSPCATCSYVVQQPGRRPRRLAGGLGNVERTGMGPEKLDNTVYFIRGLYDLADMAQSKHDGATYAWAKNLAGKLQQRFDSTWWYQAASQYADSLHRPGQRAVVPEALDRPDADGGRAARQRPDRARPGAVRPRQRRAGRPGERLLQRHPAVQPGPVPHRLRRRRRTGRARRSSSA